jgi:hypothetical protein
MATTCSTPGVLLASSDIRSSTRWVRSSLGDPGVDLGLLQIGLGVVARGRRVVEHCLRDGLPLHQIQLPLVVGLGLLQRRLGADWAASACSSFNL